MARKTPVDKLAEAITKELEKYGDDVQENLNTITRKMGQKGATAQKQQSRSAFGKGEYAEGWTHDFRKTKRRAETTIYNERYGLPHLLENGHVVHNGTKRVVGAYPGKEHIKPIADELTSTFEEEVISKL